MPADPIAHLQQQLRSFADARDWNQFHSPKNLSMALAVEAAELLEIFQWMTQAESAGPGEAALERIRMEVADVFIYLVRLADILQIDLMAEAEAKMRLNDRKYPVERVRGDARKYNEYEDERAHD